MAISNASNQIVKVNLIPGIIPSVLHLSQYDTGAGRPVTFSVYDGSQAFTIPSGVSIAFEGTKPDGNGFSFTCTKSGSNALLTNYTNQMTALPGKIMCQLVFTDTSGGRVGSLPVLMVVTPAGINGDTVISDSDIEAIIAAQNQYAVLNAKLDTAISAATQDSEVQDIRVKADGTTAATAGNAVREQITELKNDLSDNIGNISETETMVSTFGSFTINSTQIQYVNRGASRGIYFKCEPNKVYQIKKTDGDKFEVGYVKGQIAKNEPLYGYISYTNKTGVQSYKTGNDATYVIVICNLYGTFTEANITVTRISTAKDSKAREAIESIGDSLDDYEKVEMFSKLNSYTKPASANLLNYPEAQMDKSCNPTTGIISDHTNYWCSGFCKVTPGQTLYLVTKGLSLSSFIYVAAFDAEKNVVPNAGVDQRSNNYTVPSGVEYIILSLTYATSWTYWRPSDYMLSESNAPTSWEQYSPEETYYLATDEFLKNTSALTNDTLKSNYMEKTPRNMLDPDSAIIGAYIPKNGDQKSDAAYWCSDYIPVTAGETLRLYSKSLTSANWKFTAAYDANKQIVESAGSNDSMSEYTVPQGIDFIRISRSFRTTWTYYAPEHFMLSSVVPTEFLPYSSEESYIFRPEFIPNLNAGELHVYLPGEICVGIGRTIELYNSLICLESEKYHLHYSCSIGVQYDRKFTIIGTSVGTYALALQIFDDDMKMVWSGQASVKVVANNIDTQKKIIPIGDSLTNLKPWLREVQNLSDNKIIYIGTRGRSDNTIRHEGRSGFTAKEYNANTPYTFDTNYQGAGNIQGSVNPFWDVSNNKFSLAYYISTQGGTVGTPDAVQLLLGTNDVFGRDTPEQSAQDVVDLVDAIRSEYPSMPIFVCNTIYRSNQNGYYSSGGQGFRAASGWAFDSDMKIMELQNALAEKLQGYGNVYIMPLSVCMDRDYDFGNVATAVNPRLTDITINIPNESVHPQEAGYMQMADVMYSSFIAHLT